VIALLAGCARLKPDVRAVDPKVLTKLTVFVVAFSEAVFLAFGLLTRAPLRAARRAATPGR
jgi:hypothetical protein